MSIEREITQWIKFAKGDLPGHPFRGNQYTEAVAGAAETARIHNAATRREGMNMHLTTLRAKPAIRNAKHAQMAELHAKAAESFKNLADKIAAEKGTDSAEYKDAMTASEAHDSASKAHASASSQGSRTATATHGEEGGRGGEKVRSSTDATYDASMATGDAVFAGENALGGK